MTLGPSLVVPADDRVELAGGVLHLRGGLDGLSVAGDGDTLCVGVHVYHLGGDGASVHDDVLQDVARGVADLVTFQRRVRVVRSVISFIHVSSSKWWRGHAYVRMIIRW